MSGLSASGGREAASFVPLLVSTVAVQFWANAGESWRIEWREDVRGRDGTAAASNHYQATVTIGVSPPRDEATIRANPLGLYINAFNWARRL